jgi:hypothetical protein
MDRHDFTIWLKPIEPTPYRFLSRGSSRLQDPRPMAEIWVAFNQLLALPEFSIGDHDYHFLDLASREESIESA